MIPGVVLVSQLLLTRLRISLRPAMIKGTATGPKMQEALNFLEKKIKTKSCADGDWKDVVELGITTLNSVLSVDFKKNELEIGIVGGPKADGEDGSEPGFRTLTEEEIDERLQAIADKD